MTCRGSTELAEYHNVEIHALDKGRVTAVDVGLAGVLNPIQIEQIRQRTHRSLEEQVLKEGKSAGGLSYGYRISVDDKGLRIVGELEVDEAQAAVVLRILREYVEGRTPREIAVQLNRDRIPPPASGKRKATPAWGQTTITGNPRLGTGILNSRLYVGVRVWNERHWVLHPETRKRVSRRRDASKHVVAAVPHLRIVPDDLWAAVKARQEAIDAKRGKRPATDRNGLSASQGVRKIKYLSSGLLRCGRCGGYLTIAGSGDKRHYCANARQKGDAICAGMRGLRQEEAERRVLSGLRRDLLTDGAYAAFRATVESQAAALAERANADLRRTDEQVAEAQRSVQNLVAAIAKGRHCAALLAALENAEGTLAGLEEKRRDLLPLVIDPPADLPKIYREPGGPPRGRPVARGGAGAREPRAARAPRQGHGLLE